MTVADSTVRKSTNRENRALLGIVAVFAVANSVITGLGEEHTESIVLTIMYTLLALEPVLFGVWIALGNGSFLKRLIISIPLLLLLALVPGYVPEAYADIRKNEFVMMIVTGIGITAIVAVIFLLFRYFTGFRIGTLRDTNADHAQGIRFSIKDLIGLTTLWAIVLGLMIHLQFQTRPDPATVIFGPNFYMWVLATGAAFATVCVLPTLIVPLSVLHGGASRFAMVLVGVLWLAISLIVTLTAGEGDGFIPFLCMVFAYQFSAAAIGGAVAFALRRAGFRLGRSARNIRKIEVADAPD